MICRRVSTYAAVAPLAGTSAPPLDDEEELLELDELLELEEDELLELELDEDEELLELELELDEELDELEELDEELEELELLEEPESDPDEPPPHAAMSNDNDKAAITASDRLVGRCCMFVSVSCCYRRHPPGCRRVGRIYGNARIAPSRVAAYRP